MGVVQVELPDHLKAIIDRHVAEGRVESESAYLEEAVRRYAEELEDEDEVIAIANRRIADIEAGRYVLISTPEDSEALHQHAMDRLRARACRQIG